ncbi:hypothetical protein M0802_005917 [Mischocyttarus mexicanus]|nr:hypothetical protein M0802_005917 [Mischocyttarus mexicanus]
MIKNIDYKVFRLVLNYLTINELDNVARVCRSWFAITMEIKEGRKRPVIIIRKRNPCMTRQSWLKVKKLFLQHLIYEPRINIVFTNDKYVKNYSEECHCNMLPSTCCTIHMESHFPFKNVNHKNYILSLFFPQVSKLNIETYTFIRKTLANNLFCQEIRFNCGNDVGLVKFLKTQLKPYFKLNSEMGKCMIIFGCDLGFESIIQLVNTLQCWFPVIDIPIFGSIVDVLKTCQCCFDKNYCQSYTEYIIIFISNPDMKVWTLILDETCLTELSISEKLTNLKKQVNLKNYTVAFMHVSARRIQCYYALETYLFTKIFPNIMLFPIYGERSFGGNNWEEDKTKVYFNMIVSELEETMPVDNVIMYGPNTTIMIITYN